MMPGLRSNCARQTVLYVCALCAEYNTACTIHSSGVRHSSSGVHKSGLRVSTLQGATMTTGSGRAVHPPRRPARAAAANLAARDRRGSPVRDRSWAAGGRRSPRPETREQTASAGRGTSDSGDGRGSATSDAFRVAPDRVVKNCDVVRSSF